jgi:hypothetical protein
MPVYHLTIHAYRSWGADHHRGYVQRGRGIMPPEQSKADWHDANAVDDPFEFDKDIQKLLIGEVHAACRRYGWRLHGAGTDLTHLHTLVSWREFVRFETAVQRIKGALSHKLGQVVGPGGRRWFSKGASERRVRDRKHFDHLIEEYFPGHPLHWREGLLLP